MEEDIEGAATKDLFRYHLLKSFIIFILIFLGPPGAIIYHQSLLTISSVSNYSQSSDGECGGCSLSVHPLRENITTSHRVTRHPTLTGTCLRLRQDKY